MLLIYNPLDGEIFYVVKTSDIPTFTHSSNIPLETAEIPDEDDTIQEIRSQVYASQGRKNETGQGRFFIDTSTPSPTLNEREAWKEVI